MTVGVKKHLSYAYDHFERWSTCSVSHLCFMMFSVYWNVKPFLKCNFVGFGTYMYSYIAKLADFYLYSLWKIIKIETGLALMNVQLMVFYLIEQNCLGFDLPDCSKLKGLTMIFAGQEHPLIIFRSKEIFQNKYQNSHKFAEIMKKNRVFG